MLGNVQIHLLNACTLNDNSSLCLKCTLRWLETLFEKCEKNGFGHDIIHLMCAPEGNREFCFPESLNVSRDEVEGNIETRGKIKLTISRGSTY